MRTIRARIIAIVLGTISACWIVLVLLTQTQTRSQVTALMEQRAEDTADILLAIFEGEATEGVSLTPEALNALPPTHTYQSEPPFPFQWWIEDDLRARTSTTPEFPPPTVDTPPWREAVIGGDLWRIHTRTAVIDARSGPANAFAVVGVHVETLNALVDSLIWQASLPLLLTLPVLAIVTLVGIVIGLRPLQDLARQVAARSPGWLTPVPEEDTPGEVAPLVSSLNRLFDEVKRTLANEQRFTADAAHELRTPLGALSAQAQVALSAENDLSRERALRQIVDGVTRIDHIITQLLTLARLDPQSDVERESVDLVAVTREVMASLGPLAVGKGLDMSLETTEPTTTSGDPALIAILIRNLIDNAVKYSPVDGAVAVSVRNSDGYAEIDIADTGPGIPPDQRAQARRRFVRLGHSEEFGTGLGLSIADRIASLHAAEISFLDRDGPGLVVAVRFPATRQPKAQPPPNL